MEDKQINLDTGELDYNIRRNRADALSNQTASGFHIGSVKLLTAAARSRVYFSTYSDQLIIRTEYSASNGHNHEDISNDMNDWRMKDRLKTVSCLLCVCLNIGVDPPDPMVTIKPNPCARLECFTDPFRLAPQKSLNLIGKTLQSQYEQIQPRARYKQALDPTADDLKKTLLAMRRSAKDERILFHYNGHGVPRPTLSHELWVFNKSYTQYIPVSIHDIIQWIGHPAVYVLDVSSAALLIPKSARDSSSKDFYLAACDNNETLPLNHELPADLFTSCLTCPIETSLLFFIINYKHLLSSSIDYTQYITRIPGRIQDRKTPLGELYWIFTAITDTIAFTSLPLEMFKILFRQDLMVAALFRNFLLAQWIMQRYGCNPVSVPSLSSTVHHDLWSNWEYVLERIIIQLPTIISSEPEIVDPISEEVTEKKSETIISVVYQQSSFFSDQLSSFESWLNTPPHKQAPTHLPIVLQVLLSQHFRYRALILLCKFLDLGKWAVHHALSVGIFPYILKLLQSPAADLKLPLVFIWSRIVLFSPQSALDLGKESGYQYFLNMLFANDESLDSSAEIRTMATFILNSYAQFDSITLVRSSLHLVLSSQIQTDDVILKQWSLLTLSILSEHADKSWTEIVKKVGTCLSDKNPTVRACAVYFLSSFIRHNPDQLCNLIATGLGCIFDSSPLVRYELLNLIEISINDNELDIQNEAIQYWKQLTEGESGRKMQFGGDSFAGCIWKVLLSFSSDPIPKISITANKIIDSVCNPLISTIFPHISEKTAQERYKTELARSYILQHCSQILSEPQITVYENNNVPSSVFKELETISILQPISKKEQYVLDNGAMMSTIVQFHPRDDAILIVDENSKISVWNYLKQEKIVTIPPPHIKPRLKERITHLSFLSNDRCFLLSGTDHGIVRVYDDVFQKPKLISAWRCVPELLPDESGSGLVLNWNSQVGYLYASGDVKSVKVWDMDAEICIKDIPTQTSQSTTAIDSTDFHLITGDAKGRIKLFDIRMPITECCVKTWKEHRNWIVQVKIENEFKIKSVSADGYLKFWDARMNSSYLTCLCDDTGKISCSAFHERLPHCIIGTSSQMVKTFQLQNDSVQNTGIIRSRDGFLSPRLSPVTSVAYHPFKNVYASGGLEQYVTVFQ